MKPSRLSLPPRSSASISASPSRSWSWSAVLASVGTAGIPGSGLVMLTIVLNAVNLPLETIGLLAGIDRILNMARVIPNIVGDAAAAVMVAKSEGELHPELVKDED